jgi:DtxR family Mn-dependent transcriptional regulator
MPQLSPSSEDYLEAVYRLSLENPHVHAVQIAQQLSVSKPSVTKAVAILRAAGLIAQEPYGTLRLTEKGRLRAKEIYSRHRMLKDFLTLVLGVDGETAEADACRMEHVISPQTLEKWTEYMIHTHGYETAET